MLNDRALMRKAAKEIVRESGRSDLDEAGLGPLDTMFHRHDGIHVFIPIKDEIACRRCLLLLSDELPGLIAQIDRLPTPRSKRLLAQSTLQKWSQSFKRLVKKNGKDYHALD